MAGTADSEVRKLLETLQAGTPTDALFEATYRDLRRLAQALVRREPPGPTLQATALVNEAYARLVGSDVDWTDRRHFVNTVARAMRQVLVDRGRRSGRRRGAVGGRITLAEVDVDTAATFPPERAGELEQAVHDLETSNPRWGEVVHLRFFGGLTVEQTAELTGISTAQVKRDWRFARAWLHRRLTESEDALGPGTPAADR